jgi:hypothetical protein
MTLLLKMTCPSIKELAKINQMMKLRNGERKRRPV